jgi:hypothetical protein
MLRREPRRKHLFRCGGDLLVLVCHEPGRLELDNCT